eukprot:6186595-Pyramimonas_sp.AAC.1
MAPRGVGAARPSLRGARERGPCVRARFPGRSAGLKCRRGGIAVFAGVVGGARSNSFSLPRGFQGHAEGWARARATK